MEPNHIDLSEYFCVLCFEKIHNVDGFWQCGCFRVGMHELDCDYHQKPNFWMDTSADPTQAAKNCQMARLLRLAVIKNIQKQGILTREEALELLNANLTPDKPETYSDDRFLFDMTFEEAWNATKPQYSA